MKPLAVLGLVLIVLGLAGLALGHISFTTEKKVLDVGPVTASVNEEHHIAVPDVAGVVAVGAGVVLLLIGMRPSRGCIRRTRATSRWIGKGSPAGGLETAR